MSRREILFEGMTEAEILALPEHDIDGFILLGEPLVFKAGSAILLGSFRVTDDRVTVELAQIDGGGGGVLIALGSLARRYAMGHSLQTVEWIVHAVTCVKPNQKLRTVISLFFMDL